jgi:acetyl esterase/lipase
VDTPEKISLWNGNAPGNDGKQTPADAFATVYRPACPNGKAVVICPGGGYGGRMDEPEGHGIARWFNQHGITGVALEYRLPFGNSSVPLADAQRALRMVRSQAASWTCDPNQVGIVGFSAGGHLAATVSTHFDDGDIGADDPVSRAGSRPDFSILIYPVISMAGMYAHVGSRKNLMGENPVAQQMEFFSCEKQVTDQTPPAFLAHALNDDVVSIENSRMYCQALQDHGVSAELLELPSGGHGLNGYSGSMWEAWKSRSLEWLAAL